MPSPTQLKYPPVLDAKLEQAAAGLQAIMQDLAEAAPQEAAQQVLTLISCL